MERLIQSEYMFKDIMNKLNPYAALQFGKVNKKAYEHYREYEKHITSSNELLNIKVNNMFAIKRIIDKMM